MDDAEFRRRLDAHMERGNAHMERGNRLMERSNELMAQNRAAFDENMRAFRELSEILTEQIHALRHLAREVVVGMREGREEMRAQREALFRILDRLDGRDEAGGGAPA